MVEITINSLIKTIIEKLSNNKSDVDITYETQQIMNSAHRYGVEMEEMFNEPMEYTTSYCEVIDGFTCELAHYISNLKNDFTHVTDIYMDDEFVTQVNSCQTSRNNMIKFYSYFPNLNSNHN